MNEFINWTTLSTYGGALSMVMVLTQFTKDIGITKRIPTQIWSYILALIVLVWSMVFTDGLTLNTFVLTLFNAAIISIGANGGFSAIQKLTGKDSKK